MSVCRGIGNGIGGAIGKWGAGLGSALGLGAVVDVAVRAYTGYGLLDTLSVPYIECPDGSFASAIEWYGSGLKCPGKKPDPPSQPTTPPSISGSKAALGYDEAIAALGGATYSYWAVHWIYEGPSWPGEFNTLNKWKSGHGDPKASNLDSFGNVGNLGNIAEGTGGGPVRGPIQGEGFGVNKFGYNYGDGGWGSRTFPAGVTTREYLSRNPGLLPIYTYSSESSAPSSTTRMGLVGIRVSMPPNYEKAPPVANMPPPPGFQPTPPRKNKEDCEEVACPCLTPADIEQAVKRALGLRPFAPEKLVREIGARMYAAPGPSLVPIVPVTLLDAIAAIQATSYMRGGYGRYPVVMPDSIVADDNPTDVIPTLPIENYAEWFEWWLKQFDAIMGQFPIKIAIVDGAKRQPLKFENVSEAIAEMTGLAVQISADADAAVAVGSHAAVAATKAQCAAIVAQKNAECIIKFFGVRTAFSSVFVQSAITPQDSDNPTFNLKKFLTPSQQAVAFLTDNDPFDFQAILDRILRNSEIAKSAVALDAKSGLVGDYAKNQRKYDTAEARREAEKELDKLQTAINANNPEFQVKIRVDTPATDEISGNNFVIKRPQSRQNE